MTMSTIDEILASATRSGLPRLDGQLLLLHAWGADPQSPGERRAWLLSHGEASVTGAVQQRFDALVRRRLDGEPLAYLTGHKEFFGLPLAVDARVLVPRPDTEVLVEWALEILELAPSPHATRPQSVLDLGTGSGAVALAIKHTRPDLQVDAVDASTHALAVAEANARRLGLAVHFLAGHWFEPVRGRYDCIASNPPYVAAADPHLPALRHEPREALVAGPDGLQDIRLIIAAAGLHLHPGGWLLIEHGYDQGQAVRALFASAGFAQVSTRRDIAHLERCTGGRVIADGVSPMVK
jgi:release factor glutamine methyltransferase